MYIAAAVLDLLNSLTLRMYLSLGQRKLQREYSELKKDAAEALKEKLRLEVLKFTETLEESILEKITNKKTLTELLHVTATEEDYDLFVADLIPALKDLYESYQFQLLKPTPGDYQSGYALGFQLFRVEMAEQYDRLFRLAIDKGMTEAGITKAFIRAVKAGDLIDLGDAVIVDHGTGVSSILTGDDLSIYVTFMTEEYKAKKEEVEAEQREKAEKEEAEKEAYLEQRKKTFETLTDATDVLAKLTEEVRQSIPEEVDALEEEFELVRDLYGKV